MQRLIYLLIFVNVLFIASAQRTPVWEPQISPPPLASLRGISSVSADVAWASGSEGTVLRTIDGGQNWIRCNTPGGLIDVQYRDIEAFDANTAIVMGVGTPARFYKTGNGGQTWDLKYYSDVNGTFYDAIDFWDNVNGIAFGDAINGRLTIVKVS